MARLSAEPIVLSASERKELEALIGRHKTSQQIVLRAKIILQAAEGHGHGEIARGLNVSRDMSRLWRRRWLALSERGIPVVERLKDAPRPGCPATFSIEQLTRLYAMACDPPEKYGRPIDHWSARELADEMVKQGLVERISPRHVRRLLAEAELKPYQCHYWLHPPPDPDFEVKLTAICDVYAQAQARLAEGEMTLCFDEMTGIQALERVMPDIPMKPGRVRQQEFEYLRHGTQSLMTSLNVAQGAIAHATVGATRTEADLEAHVKAVLAQHPNCSKYRWVMDGLNTHQSEAMVRLVASLEPDPPDFGHKGRSGILKSMASRSAFLADPTHRMVIYFTPKHCSWLNQMELWFSILMRKLLRRGNFTSQEDLKAQILAFVDYFNRTMAKPFKWTYKGKPLVV